jgi:ferredoxin
MSPRMRIDRIACTGHGMCAELLPEKIVLDEWGYPILDGKPVEPWLEALARRAARDCPVLALKLTAERGG